MDRRFKSTSRLVVAMFLLAIVSTASGKVIYVDDDMPADFNTIQAAIDDSNDGDTIIVADGIYTGEGNRDIDFLGKAIVLRSENGPENCIIDCNGTLAEKHRGFYFHSQEDSNSVLTGFTVTNGHGLHWYPFPVLAGGAIFCKNSSPRIANCIIKNSTGGFGGGILCHSSSPVISDCTISSNSAVEGGGMYNYENSCVELINCTFSGNEADLGGGIFNRSESEPNLINCILWGNMPDQIVDYDYPLSSTTVMFSDVQDGWTGLGNIDADPCFSDPCNGDYHLKSQAGRWDASSESWVNDDVTSPCIDAGNPMGPIGLEPFPNGGIINIGAYGGTAEASKSYFGRPVCEIIVAGDVNGDCIVNFTDFALMALHWLEDNNP